MTGVPWRSPISSRRPRRESRGAAAAGRLRVSPRIPVQCSRSHDHAGEGPWTATVEEGLGIPSAGPRGEHDLSVHIDHRRCTQRPDGSWAPDRGVARMPYLESDDRVRSARVLPYWALRCRSVGLLPRPSAWCCNNALKMGGGGGDVGSWEVMLGAVMMSSASSVTENPSG